MQKNYFALFGLQPDFFINKSLLDEKYFILMKENNPNTCNQYSESHTTADINNAYKVLKNDQERSLHLLELRGVNISEYSSNDFLDSDTYEQIFNQMEHVSSLRNVKDLLNEKKSNAIKIEGLYGELNKSFIAEETNEMVIIYLHVKYLHRLDQHISNQIKNLS